MINIEMAVLKGHIIQKDEIYSLFKTLEIWLHYPQENVVGRCYAEYTDTTL